MASGVWGVKVNSKDLTPIRKPWLILADQPGLAKASYWLRAN